jgi:cysteine-rich repeat protein/VCBS repeat-containing protein
MAQVCGDGDVTPPETCDDGNTRGGDGCDAACQLDNSIDFVDIVGGAYLRGSITHREALPIKLVSLEDFQVSRTEITVFQYKRCVDAGVCSAPSSVGACTWDTAGQETHPINCLTWSDALKYADWLNSMDTQYTIGLITESQWEYVAKSQGQDIVYPWGDDPVTCDRAILRDSGFNFGCGGFSTAPVCSRSQTDQVTPPTFAGGDSNQGICDLVGNVAEWTQDFYEQNYRDAPVDGSAYVGFLGNRFRIVRGGSWTSTVSQSDASYRGKANKNSRNINFGVRLSSTLSCGDGVLDRYEECDDNNIINGDGCDDHCRFECGNNQIDGAEECDDGNRDVGDGCDDSCFIEVCGNSIVQDGEACDDGNDINGDGCDLNCNDEVCGNGVVQGHLGEQCDDENSIQGDGCDNNCKIEECGNNAFQPHIGEECDDGNDDDDDGCNNLCEIQVCGDGQVQGSEVCDDGANNSDVQPGACRTNCQNPGCGDGVVDLNEGCDDGVNNSDTAPNACRTNCQNPGCGDGVHDADEDCDNGVNNSDTIVDACRTTCDFAGCGDGVQDTNEDCDNGANNSDVAVDACRTTCVNPSCGDGVQDTNDQCDDGNLNHTDGCDENCLPEVCGNNVIQNYERRYLSVTGGSAQSCGIMVDDHINCWGETLVGIESSKSVPGGEFSLIDIGSAHACAVGVLNNVECWGANDVGQADPPADQMVDVSAGLMDQSCGIKLNGEIVCWGAQDYGFGVFPDPPLGSFKKVSVGGDFLTLHACAINTNDGLECWGDNDQNQTDVPAGSFVDLSAGSNFTCALATNGSISCWGNNDFGQLDAPAGNFVELSTHFSHSCARTDQDTLVCWGGFNDVGELDAPAGTFISVDVGFSHSCAVNFNNQIVCWGDNGLNQSTPTPGPYEDCDDGNTVSGDGCDETCTQEICGNGVQQGNEQCDDGNNISGDGCDATCTLEFCGNNITQQTEDCDDGGINTLTCNANCTTSACGDGFHNPVTEECDSQGESQECDINCTLASCGDGDVNATRNEDCDDSGESADCNTDCTNSVCGDGVHNATDNEECDNGFNNSDVIPDQCRQDCKLAHCGDNVIDDQETCDDGNAIDDDTCNQCQIAECGDGVRRTDLAANAPGFEQCDDGNDSDKDACKAGCISAVCGDGIIRVDLVPVDPGFESCDDGNTDNGDGCSSLCVVEPGVVCVGEPSVCVDDADADGVVDLEDDCPNGETGWTSNVIADYDSDGCKDDALEDQDDDNDGVNDNVDLCAKGNLGWGPSAPNNDADGDGCEDDSAEDTDDDNDGLLDVDEDLNQDGVLDANETDPKVADTDADGVNDDTDNCPRDANGANEDNQADHNGDDEGDACETGDPVAQDDTFNTDEDIPVSGDVSTNDVDGDGDALTASIIVDVDPANGALAFNNDGTFTFTPAPDFAGLASFTYTINDGRVDSNIATVTVNIAPVNDPPVASPDSFATDEDVQFSSPAAGLNIANNDSDPEGFPLTVSVVDDVSNGTLTFNGNEFTYLPNANYEGADSFTYLVSDGLLDSNIVTVSITVNPVNDAPIANFTDPQSAEEGGVIVNGQVTFEDPDQGDTFTFADESAVAIDGFTFNAVDGSWSFDPTHATYDELDAGDQEVLTVTYRVTDAAGETDTSSFDIIVTGTNDAPVATFVDPQVATEDGAIVAGNLTADDVDADDTLTFSLDAPIPGVTVNADGSWAFDPSDFAYQHLALGTPQAITVNYTVTDFAGATSGNAFVITVTGDNDAPQADFTTQQDVNEGDVVVNGQVTLSDIDAGDTHTYSHDNGPIDGFTFTDADGSWTFDPGHATYDDLDAGDIFTITINYTVTDNNVASGSNSFDIVVTGTNDAPVATFSANENTTEDNPPVTRNLTATDVDADDNGNLTFSIDNPPAGLTLVGDAWTFDPGDQAYQHIAQGDTETITVTYTVADLAGVTSQGTFDINIAGANDAPLADFTDQQAATEGGAVLNGQIVVTDVDDNDTLQFTSAPPAIAGFIINNDGSFSLDPTDAAYDELDEGDLSTLNIPYTVTDAVGANNSGIFNIVVTGTNDAPIATFVAAQAVNEDAAPITDTLTAADVDADDVLVFSLDAVTPGLTLVGADWTFDASDDAYQALAIGEQQVIAVSYTVTDSQGVADQESFNITVTGTNDAPIATFSTQQDVNEGNGMTNGQLTATDVDNGDLAGLTFAKILK